MKQRFYLSEDYAQLLANRAAAAGVDIQIYLQCLIAQDQICGGPLTGPTPASLAVPVAPGPSAAESSGIRLGGDWGTL